MRTWFVSFTIALALSLVVVLTAHAQGPLITITQIDQSRFPQVDVYISVTDAGGNPVRNVPASAFRLEENGKEMALTAATRSGEQGPVSTVLIIDRSGSMHFGGKMAGAKQAATTFVNLMRPGDRTALIQFDTDVETLQPMTEDKRALLAAIQKIVPRGNTALYDALNQAARHFETAQGRKAVIVVTDGMDNASKVNRETILKQAGEGGFPIYTIGLGAKGAGYGSQEGIDESVLRELANASYGEYFYTPDASQLSGFYQQLSLRIQNEYRLTYVSPNALRDGLRHAIVVTAPGAAPAHAAFNPGGVIPEVEPQWWSWLLFFVALVLLIGLFFAPTSLRLVRERVLPHKPKPRVKLTGAAPTQVSTSTRGTAGATAPTAGAARPPRVKIVKEKRAASSDEARSRLPWDEDATEHQVRGS